MRQVYINREFARVGFYKSVLDEAGIQNLLRDESALSGLIGDPSLCVIDDADYDRAMELLAGVEYSRPETADWRCAKCEAEVPGTFDSCWQCGALRDAGAADEPGA